MRASLGTFLSFSIFGLAAGCSGQAAAPPDAGQAPVDTGTVHADAAAEPDAGTPEADAGFAPDALPGDAVDNPLNPTWTSTGSLPPAAQPSDLWGAIVVEIPGEHRFFVLGGNTYPTGGTVADAYFYNVDTGVWTPVTAPGNPSPRYCHCAAYLPEQHAIFVNGGRDDNNPSPPGGFIFDLGTETWSRSTGRSPNGVIGCNAVWMPSFPGGGRVILFGGDSFAGVSNQTWAFDPGTKTYEQLMPATVPPSRRDSHLAYDPGENGNGRVLMWSGSDSVYPPDQAHQRDDLWSFDGNDWTTIPQGMDRPVARRYAASAFDTSRREWIIFGGTKETNDFDDLWRFDMKTDTWQKLDAVVAGGGDLPAARGFPLFGYDADTRNYVLYGGYSQPAYRNLKSGWRLVLRP
ncbi:MAG: kelch repeat-containing protein [Myxococcota bacterium]